MNPIFYVYYVYDVFPAIFIGFSKIHSGKWYLEKLNPNVSSKGEHK